MKRLIIICMLLVTFAAVDANALSCSSTENLELKKISNQIEISYDLEDLSSKVPLQVGNNKTTYLIPKFVYKINIYNIRDDVYVVLSNDVNNVQIRVDAMNTDKGVYTYEQYDYTKIYNYKLSIYSNRIMCKGDLVGTKKLTTPKYNPYSEYEYCKTSDEDFCKKFITKDLTINSDDAFLAKIKEINGVEEDKSLLEEIKDNKVLIIIIVVGTILLSLVYVGIQEMLRRRYDKEL